MADLALTWDETRGAADAGVSENDLAPDAGLETAVLLSLFVDRRADAADILPDEEADRRGWWADAFPTVAGDAIGSRLWLLAREKQTATLLPRLEGYAREALQWLLDDGVAERVDVAASFPQPGWVLLSVEIARPGIDPVLYRFNRVWLAEGA